jgi:hypothetical protein
MTPRNMGSGFLSLAFQKKRRFRKNWLARQQRRTQELSLLAIQS